MNNINLLVKKLQKMKRNCDDWLTTDIELKEALYQELDEAIKKHQTTVPMLTVSVNNNQENNYLETFNVDDEGDIDECFFTAQQKEAMEITKQQVVDILRLELMISPDLQDYDTWTVYSEGREIYQLTRR